MVRPLLSKPRPNTPSPQDNMNLFNEVRLDGGMNTRIDSADLPPNTLRLAQNCYVTADQIRRSAGATLFTPTKPNSSRISQLFLFERFNGDTILLRFDNTKLFRRTGLSWTEVTSASPYSVSSTTRIRVLPINDRLFFAPGNGPIREINFAANTYAAAGNAGAYRYITGFFNRVVGANLYDVSSPNPILMGWSGDINFTQWNPITDISAGSTPLLEAASDFSDPVTGLFGFASVMLILRERSLWTATKRPVASNPFQFQAAFPFVGCDTPNSAAQKRNGIVWYDSRSNQVYDYTIGQVPREVGDPIREELKSKITDKELPQGTYNSVRNEYILTIPGTTTTLTHSYILNLDNGAWTYRTYEDINGVYFFDSDDVDLTINDLSGTINQLVGTINSLSNTTTSPPRIYFTRINGDILSETVGSDTFDGTTISTILESKVYANPDRKMSVSRLRFSYVTHRAGAFTIQYNNGNGWRDYKTVPLATTNRREWISCVKHILAREFQWRILSTSGDFSILNYSIDFTSPDLGR